MNLCEYGCGREAKFQLKNQRWCCEPSWCQCPINKKKNSDAVKKNWKLGSRISSRDLSEEIRRNMGRKSGDFQLKIQSELSWDQCSLGEKQRRVLKEQDSKCSICFLSEWLGKAIKLHFDHINGNHNDNSRTNVRFVCPNCHSQTETYCRSTRQKIFTDEEFKIALEQNDWRIDPALKQLGLARGGYNWTRAKKLVENRASGEIGRHVRLQSGAL